MLLSSHAAAIDVEAEAEADSSTCVRAVARALPGVVTIRALGNGRDGYGAGIVVDASGLVLTALHVTKDAAAIAIVLDGGEEFPAKQIAVDQATDLALLRAVAPGRRFTAASLAPDEPHVGETMLAISNPFGLGLSVSRGILSARDRRDVVGHHAVGLLQTDAAINPGSSGGALINLDGAVVGLITAILTRTGGHQGVGFAVPAHEIARVVRHLVAGEPVRRPWLGVRVLRAADGLRLKRVTAGGPAAAAGLRAGDVLRRLAGTPLTTIDDLRRALRRLEVGDAVRVDFEREGKLDALEVTIADRPKLLRTKT